MTEWEVVGPSQHSGSTASLSDMVEENIVLPEGACPAGVPASEQVILLAGASVGKSAVANMLLGHAAFPSRVSSTPVTNRVQSSCAEWFGCPVKLIDTPGDNSLALGSAVQEHTNLSAVLFLVSAANRVARIDQQWLQELNAMFSEAGVAPEHMLVVGVTHVDAVDAPSLRRFLEALPAAFEGSLPQATCAAPLLLGIDPQTSDTVQPLRKQLLERCQALAMARTQRLVTLKPVVAASHMPTACQVEPSQSHTVPGCGAALPRAAPITLMILGKRAARRVVAPFQRAVRRVGTALRVVRQHLQGLCKDHMPRARQMMQGWLKFVRHYSLDVVAVSLGAGLLTSGVVVWWLEALDSKQRAKTRAAIYKEYLHDIKLESFVAPPPTQCGKSDDVGSRINSQSSEASLTAEELSDAAVPLATHSPNAHHARPAEHDTELTSNPQLQEPQEKRKQDRLVNALHDSKTRVAHWLHQAGDYLDSEKREDRSGIMSSSSTGISNISKGSSIRVGSGTVEADVKDQQLHHVAHQAQDSAHGVVCVAGTVAEKTLQPLQHLVEQLAAQPMSNGAGCT